MHSVIGIEAFDQSQVHGKVPQQPKLPTTLHALPELCPAFNCKVPGFKGSSALSVQLQTKSSELTYSTQQLGCSSEKAERFIV
jgi:hypothetical protein